MSCNHCYLRLYDHTPLAKKVLIVTLGFRPNIGGLETHLSDLTSCISDAGYYYQLLTYQPLTSNQRAPFVEHTTSGVVYRLPIIGKFFYKLVHNPILEFLYLAPLLWLALPFILLGSGRDVKVIHSHGLICGLVSLFWAKLLNKKIISTTHSYYSFPSSGFFRLASKLLFTNSDSVLCLSQASSREVASLGVDPLKIKVFTYWIDTDLFSPQKINKISKRFTVLFVGRLVSEKGILELINASKLLDPSIVIKIAGDGPLKKEVINQKTIEYLGPVHQSDLPSLYSTASVTIVPSIHDEGFGRVILESLSCGTPVIASNRGAIPEAMNSSVGVLIDVSVESILKTISQLSTSQSQLQSLKKNCRPFALSRYTSKNSQVIIDTYDELR